jgi:predicted patatin/cPLA2 family phospholipase
VGRPPQETKDPVGHRPTRSYAVKRIDQWKAKLKAAKSDIKHKTRQLNAATRSYNRTKTLIESLEKKIEVHLAKS